MRLARLAVAAPLLAAACARPAPAPRDPDAGWGVTGGEPGNSRWSPLRQIDPTNVARLRVAWTYRTGDASPQGTTQIQATPIVVRGVLYATTATLDVFALRADSGAELWRFDPF